jgi:CBS domain-containing protein
MKVAELMRTNLTTVGPDAMVAEAVVTLADGHISALPVVDAKNRLIGVVSTTDVLQAEAECTTAEDRERLFNETTVAEIMTSKPIAVAPDCEVREAAQQMLYLDIHRLFVEDGTELVGIISQSDVVRAVATGKEASFA